MSLSISNITKRFTDFAALDDVNIDVASGEFIALLGPSGSGKTTLLRLLAGLDHPDEGEIKFEGKNYISLSARERKVGMVFQSYALFRHMSVFENIAFGLKVRKQNRPSAKEIGERVSKLLELIQLEGYEKRFPSQLSGGQRQRVALARALAIDPSILLLDEPFGALDAMVRKDLRRWLRHVHDETGVTTIFVTHDQEEALDLADKIVLLNKGKIAQIGKPSELYDTPTNEFVFDFIGGGNCAIANVFGNVAIINNAEFEIIGKAADKPIEKVFFRATDCVLRDDGKGIKATLVGIFDAGPSLRLELKDETSTLYEVIISNKILGENLSKGQSISFSPTKAFIF